MLSISVIIITRNRLEKLKRCIISVQKHIPTAEIIVVDNGSTDGTQEYIQNTRNIISVLNTKNGGVAQARNQGISAATKEILMFIDDDAWIKDLDSQILFTYFKNNTSCILTPKILYPDGNIQESVRAFPTILSLFWRGTGLYRLFPNAPWYVKYVQHDHTQIHEVDWAIGACLIIPRSVLNETGTFDEKYFFGYEDVDFCYRAKQKGYKTIFFPEMQVFHEYTRSSRRIFSRPFFSHVYSILRFFLKRFSI